MLLLGPPITKHTLKSWLKEHKGCRLERMEHYAPANSVLNSVDFQRAEAECRDCAGLQGVFGAVPGGRGDTGWRDESVMLEEVGRIPGILRCLHDGKKLQDRLLPKDFVPGTGFVRRWVCPECDRVYQETPEVPLKENQEATD